MKQKHSQYLHLSAFDVNLYLTFFFVTLKRFILTLTLKELGGGIPPPSTFFVISQPVVIFFALKLHDFVLSLALDLRPFKKKIGPGVMTRGCVIERWVQRKTDQKLIFNGNYTQIVFFVFFFVSGYTFTIFYLIYLLYLE